MEQPKVISQEEVVSQLETQIKEQFAELESLMPSIGHSEAKRLLLASAKYPMEETDFSADKNDALIRCYSISKGIKDALVGLGVEVVIDQMLKKEFNERQQTAAPETTTEEVNNG
jgi:hypothetical protein